MKKYLQIIKIYAPRNKEGDVVQVNLTCATPKHPDRCKYYKFRPDELVEFLGGNPERSKNDLGIVGLRIEVIESVKLVDTDTVPNEIKNPS
ncbi:MAG: hypothetical protein LBO09_06545 [Candidatus Peribacteria bacterium]|jgi:hypothetical protein|nr:hypothetical protein [Candidatus Peribacteria bacterium]